MEERAYSPGHITAFFAVHSDASLPPERRGSRGSGFCLESGVTATVKTHGRRRPAELASGTASLPFELEVRDNGSPVEGPETTLAALAELVRRAGRHATYPERVTVDNRYTLPLGAGFGVSGACALSAALASNEVLRLSLDRSDCVAAAHVGEVTALSGLGDVGPQGLGGFEIRTREGPPPMGEMIRLGIPPAEVVLVSFGPKRTREFLSDPRGHERLNATGTNCLKRLLEAPSLDACVRLGRNFAETLGLVSGPAQDLLRTLVDPVGLGSVAMLGDSVFAFVPPESEAALFSRAGGAFFERTRIGLRGAHLL